MRQVSTVVRKYPAFAKSTVFGISLTNEEWQEINAQKREKYEAGRMRYRDEYPEIKR